MISVQYVVTNSIYHSHSQSNLNNDFKKLVVMVPTLRTIMKSSNYYEYQENIHFSVKLTPA